MKASCTVCCPTLIVPPNCLLGVNEESTGHKARLGEEEGEWMCELGEAPLPFRCMQPHAGNVWLGEGSMDGCNPHVTPPAGCGFTHGLWLAMASTVGGG